MKAIQQIIGYLQERGELSTAQLAELVALGLLERENVSELHQLPEPYTLRNETIAPDVNERRLAPKRPSRKKRFRRPRRANLHEVQLRRALQTYFQQAAPALDVAIRIAALLGQSLPWHSAIVAVRNASVSKLAQVLECGLRTHAIRWSELQDFLAENGYQKIFATENLQGSAGTAYRQLLSVSRAAHLGRNSQLLRHVEIQQLFNLRMAQKQLALAWRLLGAQQLNFKQRFTIPNNRKQFYDLSLRGAETPPVSVITKAHFASHRHSSALQSSQI